ncbi:uncharacterized protein [Branchiostoma lanceolatum]|uniref:uncharacterized protein n=1 Tax=Branchiostoma lanceolatum TaxID=7740 RepID=UPI003452806E
MRVWLEILLLVAACANADVTLKVVNEITRPTWSYVRNVNVPAGVSVYQVLLQAGADFRDFRFGATYYGYLSGHYICSINGLASSVADKAYWGFENGRSYQFDRGVDLIHVYDGDTIVFRYTKEQDRHPRATLGSFTAEQCAKFMNV